VHQDSTGAPVVSPSCKQSLSSTSRLASTERKLTRGRAPTAAQPGRVDPVRALEIRLGASWRSQLRAMGVVDSRLRSAVRTGDVVIMGGGTYALPWAEPDAVAAACARGRITCCSAARRHGLPLLHPVVKPHVVVPRNRPAASDLAVIHRGDVRGTSSVVPVLAALLTVLRCVPAVDAVATVDAAVHRGQVGVPALRSRLRGPGSVEARRVLGLVDGRSESVIESVVRLALRQAGLRGPDRRCRPGGPARL
jgi:hypothetical protein